jgi:hypothetical protein
VKVRELNALLNKLARNQQEQDVMVATGPFVWENPTLVQAKDGFYIVPKEIEDSIEETYSRDQIAQKLTEFHQSQQNRS